MLEIQRKKDLELSTVELKKKRHGEQESRHLGDLVTTRGKQPNRSRDGDAAYREWRPSTRVKLTHSMSVCEVTLYVQPNFNCCCEHKNYSFSQRI